MQGSLHIMFFAVIKEEMKFFRRKWRIFKTDVWAEWKCFDIFIFISPKLVKGASKRRGQTSLRYFLWYNDFNFIASDCWCVGWDDGKREKKLNKDFFSFHSTLTGIAILLVLNKNSFECKPKNRFRNGNEKVSVRIFFAFAFGLSEDIKTNNTPSSWRRGETSIFIAVFCCSSNPFQIIRLLFIKTSSPFFWFKNRSFLMAVVVCSKAETVFGKTLQTPSVSWSCALWIAFDETATRNVS